MKCKLCGTFFPPTYKLCPHCHSKEIKREEFAPQQVEVEEEKEDVTPFAVNGDLDDVGF